MPPQEPFNDSKFVADETFFTCEVTLPDPNATRIQNRTQGCVTAYHEGPVERNFAGNLAYFSNGARLETIRFCVQPEFRGKGCAAEMVKALRRSFPESPLASSPARPTQLGRDTLVALLHKGLVDVLQFDLDGDVCEPEPGRCDER